MPRKEFSYKPDHDPYNIIIGPSHQQHMKDLEKSLERSMARVEAEINLRKSQKEVFNEQYGEDLGNLALAYAERIRLDSHGFVHLNGKMQKTEDIRPHFAKALAEAISEQPEELRSEWLTKFLAEIDRLSPPWQR